MMKNFQTTLLVGALILSLVVLLICALAKKEDYTGGFGVISALGLYNRRSYCDPGDDHPGAAYSGGCYLPHRVII